MNQTKKNGLTQPPSIESDHKNTNPYERNLMPILASEWQQVISANQQSIHDLPCSDDLKQRLTVHWSETNGYVEAQTPWGSIGHSRGQWLIDLDKDEMNVDALLALDADMSDIIALVDRLNTELPTDPISALWSRLESEHNPPPKRVNQQKFAQLLSANEPDMSDFPELEKLGFSKYWTIQYGQSVRKLDVGEILYSPELKHWEIWLNDSNLVAAEITPLRSQLVEAERLLAYLNRNLATDPVMDAWNALRAGVGA